MKTSLDTYENPIRTRAQQLYEILACEKSLYSKTLRAHCFASNIKRSELYLLYENQSIQLEIFITEVVERIIQLGRKTNSTFESIVSSAIPRHFEKNQSENETLNELINDHETVISELKISISECTLNNHDETTADFLSDIMEEHEINVWILRKYNI